MPEAIDILIISAVLLFVLLYILHSLKKALLKKGNDRCSSCEGGSCTPQAKKECNTIEMYK